MTSFSENDINRDRTGKFAPKSTSETDTSALDGQQAPRADVKQTAAAMRTDLRKRWPDTTFSVRMSSGSAHGWIDVTYTDGPKFDDVHDVVSGYESSRFNGMDDSYHSTGNSQWSCRGVSLQRSFSDQARERARSLTSEQPDGSLVIDAGGHREQVAHEGNRDLLEHRWLSSQDLTQPSTSR